MNFVTLTLQFDFRLKNLNIGINFQTISDGGFRLLSLRMGFCDKPFEYMCN